MCGIAGLFKKENFSDDIDEAQVFESMAHRGPDATGARHYQNVSLFHLRLSILDVNARSDQPFVDPQTNVSISFNGEIYNFREIQEKFNLEVETQSDTEVVLKAYLKLGLDAIPHFRGMFALAIHDPRSQSLHLIRDRFGIKPLLYAETSDRLAFASEAKALHALGIEARPDYNSIGRYVQKGQLLVGNETWFEGVQSLEPGHILSFKNDQLEKTCYWNPAELLNSAPRTREYSEADDHEEAYDLLRSAMQEHLVSDVEIALSLSHGLDSRLLAEFLSAAKVQKMRSFTFGFEDEDYDEVRRLDDLKLPVDLIRENIRIDTQDFIPKLEKAIRIFETPLGGLGTFGATQLMQKVQESGIKVILVGEGADEVFGGYRYFCDAYFRDLLEKKEFGKLEAELTAFNQFHPDAPITKESLQKQDAAVRAPDGSILVSHDIWRGPSTQELAINENPTDSRLRNRILWDIQHVKLPKLLHFQDRATMASSVEGRVPFLDHRVFEWMAQFSDSAFVKNGISKRIPKSLMKEKMKRGTGREVKHYVATPQREWMKTDLRAEILRYLQGGCVAQSGLLDYKSFEKQYAQYAESPELGNSFFVWKLLNLEAWFQSFNLRP